MKTTYFRNAELDQIVLTFLCDFCYTTPTAVRVTPDYLVSSGLPVCDRCDSVLTLDNVAVTR